MVIAYQGCLRSASGVHSSVWSMDSALLNALARIDTQNRYLLFNYGAKSSDIADRLANPHAPNFSVFTPRLPQRIVHWAEDRLGWDPRGWLLRRRGACLLHISEQIYPAPTRFPSIVTFHDLMPELYPQWSDPDIRRIMRINARRAMHLITVSECTKRDLIRVYGVPEEKVTAIPLGLDHGIFRPLPEQDRFGLAQRLGLPSRFIVCVGPFTPRKNFEVVLQAYPRWREIVPDLALVFVGDPTPYRARLESIVSERGLARVLFVGKVSDEELAGIYSLAQALVHPTRYEGFGRPVLEAMACGCPAVAFATSSVPEVAADAALLAAGDDAQELAALVASLLKDPALRQKKSASGIARAKRFTWEQTARRHLEVYRRFGGG